ncbi:unnamed protein product [Blepharisma stoltei]|uniref:Uncharacterized protein n=1 Tax=Blepharisma stoltei TaxID=1481888 RepID=A0AAU9J9R0_9CILI|nr:unnamed protein product [Blepharisma stoltei]
MKSSDIILSKENLFSQCNQLFPKHKSISSTTSAFSSHNSLSFDAKPPGICKKIISNSPSLVEKASHKKKKTFTVNLPTLLIESNPEEISTLPQPIHVYADLESQIINTPVRAKKTVNVVHRKLAVPHSAKIDLKVPKEPISRDNSRTRPICHQKIWTQSEILDGKDHHKRSKTCHREYAGQSQKVKGRFDSDIYERLRCLSPQVDTIFSMPQSNKKQWITKTEHFWNPCKDNLLNRIFGRSKSPIV